MAQLNDPYQGKLPAKEIQKLITEFNAVPEGNHLHRIFLLHQINNLLNTVSYDDALFQWVNQQDTKDGSWEKTLKEYGINPVGSFFLKNYQFAQATALKYQNVLNIEQPKDLFDALQKRDALLLKSPATGNDISYYGYLSVYIKESVENTAQFKETLERHSEILNSVQDKVNLIRGHVTQSTADYRYKTEKLGENSNNNHNFILEVKDVNKGIKKKFVLRVEDRSSLKVEQKLHSYEVSKYFGDDAAIFMMAMKEDGDVVYKPIVVSHFANSGDLQNVARNLKPKQKSIAEITSKATHYFQKLVHFCQTLKEAETYHPDIKLSNFLVHNNMIRVCDRKTFVTQEKLLVKNIRSSPLYAPPQYYECATRFGLGPKAMTTEVNMEKFMSYQIGMAFKEFLILTQHDDAPDNFQDTNESILSSFTNHNNALNNFDYLIKALTHRDEHLRLSLDHLPQLLLFINSPPQNFVNQFKQITKIQADPRQARISNEINTVLGESNPHTLLQKANQLFERAAAEDYFSGKMLGFELRNLAEECAQTLFKGPQSYWSKYLLEQDFAQASPLKKFTHFFTRGTARVPHKTMFSNLEDETLVHSLYYQFKLCSNFEVEHYIAPKNDSDLHHQLNLKLLQSEIKREAVNHALSREHFTQLVQCTGKNAAEFYHAVQQQIPYTSLCTDQTALAIHDDLFKLLSDTTLAPEQRLANANRLFNKVNNEYTQDNRLQWLATALANQCFHEYSLQHFRKLSKQLEEKLDAENWKKASNRDKFLYYLSFGTRAVPQVAEISTVKDQIELDLKAFLPHLLPTVFVSDKTLEFYLGYDEVQNIKQYLDTQAPIINTLLQGNGTIDSQASSLISQRTISSTAQAFTFIAHTSSLGSNAQTVVINTASSGTNSQNGTVVINSVPQAASLTQSANATVVIRPVSQSPTTTVFINSVTSNSLTNTVVIKSSSAHSKPALQQHQASPPKANLLSNARAGFFAKPVHETIGQGDRYSVSLSSKSFKSQ